MLTKNELLNINGGSLFRNIKNYFKFLRYCVWEYLYYKIKDARLGLC